MALTKDIGRPAIPLFTRLFSGEGKMEYAVTISTEHRGERLEQQPWLVIGILTSLAGGERGGFF
jgi:hypothetical protein